MKKRKEKFMMFYKRCLIFTMDCSGLYFGQWRKQFLLNLAPVVTKIHQTEIIVVNIERR